MNSQIAETVSKLPPRLQKEVEDFALFLTKQEKPCSTRTLRQDWAGALKKYRDKFTSVALQKKARCPVMSFRFDSKEQ